MNLRKSLLAVIAAASATAYGQTPVLEVLPAQGNVSMIVGPGGNSAVQAGNEAVVVVDTQTANAGKALLDVIRKLSTKPIRHIIDTSASPEHTGGNEVISQAGVYVKLIDSIDPRGLDHSASIMAHVNVLARMSAPAGKEASTPSGLWPTDTYFTKTWEVYVNKEAIQMFHVPEATTDGDTVVFFRRSDVISTGDIFNADRYPFFDSAKGGSVNGVIDGLNLIIELAIPGENQIGGTVIIPGHGRMSDETDVVNYRDMLTIIRDRIQAMIAKGSTLQQVLAAKPTSDYDGLYRNNRDSWSGDKLTTEIYQDLSKRKKQ